MKRTARSLLLLALLATLGIAATGMSMAQAPSDPDMVYVRVTVADRNGRSITRLPSEQFQILEDNVPQEIAYFSETDTPISTAILFDVDGSTKDRVKETALAELTRVSSPRDELLLAEFPESPLNDAVYRALNKLLQGGNDSKRALVLFTMSSDPGANSFSRVKELLRDQDVRFYVIAMPPRPDLPGDQARPLLRELAEISGGSAFFPTSIVHLQNIYRTIGLELRNQYLIGYRSTNGTADGKWRKIKVNAKPVDPTPAREVTTRARKGYYAPTVAQSLPPQK